MAENEALFGFKLIKDMTKEELIEEIAASNHKSLLEKEINVLRGIVINFRMEEYKERLIAESGGKVNVFGALVDEDE